MGKRSREKGKRGERELAHKLQELGFNNVYRSQQYCGSATSSDLLGLQGIHIECKRTESLSLYPALEQATKDSGNSGDFPVVFHRRNGKGWIVVMRLEDWAALYRTHAGEHEI